MDIRILNLEADNYYHIYNRGINSGKVFQTDENYNYFLKQLSKYILNIADVYAYCLMPNHFHILLKIKTREEIEEFLENSKPANSAISEGLHSIKNIASKQISKFISSYTQSYNKTHNRHGGLFESPFKRIKIDSEEYLRNLIIYIHQNPKDLEIDFREYKHSSYKSILSKAKTNLMRNEIITLFDSEENFIANHDKVRDFNF